MNSTFFLHQGCSLSICEEWHFTHVDNTCTASSFPSEWRFSPLKLIEPRHFLLECLYQAWKVCGHVYVFKGYQFCLCFRLDIEIFSVLISFFTKHVCRKCYERFDMWTLLSVIFCFICGNVPCERTDKKNVWIEKPTDSNPFVAC